MRRLDAVVLVGMAALAAASADAAFGPIPLVQDPSFGVGGVSRAELPGAIVPRRIMVGADGSIYTLTVDPPGTGEGAYYLTRRSADGVLDTAGFGTAGIVTHEDSAVVGDQTYLGLCQDPASGALYLVGATEGENAFIVRRFLAGGDVDLSWGTAGLLSLLLAGDPKPYAHGCAVQPDGKLVVVGSWSAVNPGALTNRAFVARLTGVGDFDATFGSGGVFAFNSQTFNSAALYYTLTDAAMDGSGNIFAAGYVIDPQSNLRDLLITKLTTDGVFAEPYGTAGSARMVFGHSDEQIAGMRAGAGGQLTVGLLHDTSDGNAAFGLTSVRFTARGVVDVNYGCAGMKSGSAAFPPLEPFAGAFDGQGRALFVGREADAADFERVIRTSGLPELGDGGSNGEEIAHGCPPTDVLPHNGSSLPLGLLVVLGLGALLRSLRRR